MRPALAASIATGAGADNAISVHDLRDDTPAVEQPVEIKDIRKQLPVSKDHPYGKRPVSWITELFYHHSASKGQTIRDLASYHIEVKKWGGLAYTYAISWDGSVFLCNDPETISYHTAGRNAHGIAVVLIGNYQEIQPSEPMKRSVERLSIFLQEEYSLKYVALHRDVRATACPGQYAVPFLRPLCFDRR